MPGPTRGCNGEPHHRGLRCSMASSTASLTSSGWIVWLDPPHDLLLDRLGLAADLGREVPAPAVIEPGHLGEARGLPVGDPVAELRHGVSGEFFQHPSIIGPATGRVKRTLAVGTLDRGHPTHSSVKPVDIEVQIMLNNRVAADAIAGDATR